MRDEYLNELTKLINKFKEQAIVLQDGDARDEAVLEIIKANVCDIFYKIFNVSYKKTFNNLDNVDECYRNLYIMYNDFLNRISSPWKEKMTKDKEHNMFEEFYKEQIKLETVSHIRCLFDECYSKYCKEKIENE